MTLSDSTAHPAELNRFGSQQDQGNAWATIACDIWQAKAGAHSDQQPKTSSPPESKPALVATDLKSATLADPAALNAAYSHLCSDWSVPIGANSGDKQKSPLLILTDKPGPRFPDVWKQLDGTIMDGKCGVTGVANMLRLYGIEKDPKDIDKSQYRSWGFGLGASKFAEDMTALGDGKKFSARQIDDSKEDPLKVLRDNLAAGKPVAICYMTGRLEAHWVVVTGVNEGQDGPQLTVMSSGNYFTMKWNEVKYQWSRGWGGPYPYIVGDTPCDLLTKK